MSFLEKLLDGAGVEWKALGEVVLIKTGESVSKQKISNNPGDYPVINSGRKPLGFIDEWNTDNDPIGVTTRGAGVGSITWQEGKYFRGNLNYSVSIKPEYSGDIIHISLSVLQRFRGGQILCYKSGQFTCYQQ